MEFRPKDNCLPTCSRCGSTDYLVFDASAYFDTVWGEYRMRKVWDIQANCDRCEEYVPVKMKPYK